MKILEPAILILMTLIMMGTFGGAVWLICRAVIYVSRGLSFVTGWSAEGFTGMIAMLIIAPLVVSGARSALKEDYEVRRDKSSRMENAEGPPAPFALPREKRPVDPKDQARGVWKWTGLWILSLVVAIALVLILSGP